MKVYVNKRTRGMRASEMATDDWASAASSTIDCHVLSPKASSTLRGRKYRQRITLRIITKRPPHVTQIHLHNLFATFAHIRCYWSRLWLVERPIRVSTAHTARIQIADWGTSGFPAQSVSYIRLSVTSAWSHCRVCLCVVSCLYAYTIWATYMSLHFTSYTYAIQHI